MKLTDTQEVLVTAAILFGTFALSIYLGPFWFLLWFIGVCIWTWNE